MAEPSGWRLWWRKRRWYERNRRLLRRWRINRHMARSGLFIRFPVEGEVLEGLDDGRLRIGDGTLLEPGCWITMSPEARISIGEGMLPQPRHDARRHRPDRDRRPHDVRQQLLRRRRRAPLRRPRACPITWQGFTSKGPVRIGSNCWFGVNCVVTSGVEVGDRCVIGANSVVTEDLPPGVDRRRRPGEGDQGDRVRGRGRAEKGRRRGGRRCSSDAVCRVDLHVIAAVARERWRRLRPSASSSSPPAAATTMATARGGGLYGSGQEGGSEDSTAAEPVEEPSEGRALRATPRTRADRVARRSNCRHARRSGSA